MPLYIPGSLKRTQDSAVGPFRPETPVVKQMGAKTGARNLLQKLFRDNCVGINVGGIQWDNQSRYAG